MYNLQFCFARALLWGMFISKANQFHAVDSPLDMIQYNTVLKRYENGTVRKYARPHTHKDILDLAFMPEVWGIYYR